MLRVDRSSVDQLRGGAAGGLEAVAQFLRFAPAPRLTPSGTRKEGSRRRRPSGTLWTIKRNRLRSTTSTSKGSKKPCSSRWKPTGWAETRSSPEPSRRATSALYRVFRGSKRSWTSMWAATACSMSRAKTCSTAAWSILAMLTEDFEQIGAEDLHHLQRAWELQHRILTAESVAQAYGRPSPLPPPVTTAMRPAKSSMVSAPRTFAGESRARF